MYNHVIVYCMCMLCDAPLCTLHEHFKYNSYVVPLLTTIEVYNRTVSRAKCVADSIICGHHIYKAIWDPVDGEDLTCE